MTTTFHQSRTVQSFPEQAQYWQTLLAGWEHPTVLPRDYLGRSADPSLATVSVPLDPEAAGRVLSLSRGEPALVRVVCTALLAVLAARATDTEEVRVVTARPATAPADGAAFPVGLTVRGRDTLRDLLGAARESYAEATARLDVPVAHLLRSAGVTPTDFAVCAGGDVTPSETGELGCAVQWDVRLHAPAPRLDLHYRDDLFTAETARRLADTYARLLAEAPRTPDEPLAPLLAADPAEHALIDGFNATAADYPLDQPLHRFLERRAAETPGLTAIRDDGTTYAELDRRSSQLAHRLRAAGVRTGTVVGVCLPRSPLLLTTVYAVLKAGGAYLPLDPSLPANRLAYMLEHSGTRTVLGEPATRDAVPGAGTFVDVTLPGTFDGDAPAPDSGTGPDDLCYVIYTSGSTGRPKGVAVEHRAIVNRLLWMQSAYPLDEHDVVLHKTPFTFDVSVWEIFWWSLAGASVCTLPSGQEKEPARLAARIAEHSVTTMHFVPSMLQAFLQYTEDRTDRLTTLRRVFASGEALGTALAVRFAETLTAATDAALINLYGPTEAAVDVTHQPCAQTDPRRPVPIGRPIANLALRVRTRTGATAPIGTPGELCIGGTGLARGYLHAPELTAERFTADPALPGGRGYRTGDLARWLPDGTIEYLGRLDTQVKIRGYRIETGEIEHVAAGDPAVRDCAVLARTDGAGDRYLCLYAVPGEGFSEDRLRARLAAELPSYMLPRYVVAVDAIPTGHNGKRDPARLPEPERAAGDGGQEPSGPVAGTLAAIWSRALGVERVSTTDNFFALGGDSIKFVRVLAEARGAGLDFSFQDLFAHPTIAELEPRVRQSGPAAVSTGPAGLLSSADTQLLPPDAVDACPLSALQSGLLYEIDAAGGKPGLYHDIVSFRIADPLDLDLFREAAARLAAHHPMLRTSFHVTGFSEPLQIVHADAPDLVGVTDLSELDEAAQERELAAFYGAETATGFRPGAVDLVRIRLHLLGERGFQYSLSYHAAALDGWSVSLVHRDLFAAYTALRAGSEPDLEAHGTGYQDFVALEREAVASGEQRDFWLGLLEDHEGGRLPRLPGALGDSGITMHDVPLADQVSAGVLRVAESLRVPVKTVLMAAHVAVLGFVTGTDDVLTGYEHSGRPEVTGGDRLAGLFLNTLPFRARITDGSWAELIRTVYRAETGLLPHRRYPMGEMKRLLGRREPLFEAIFNFTHFHVLDDLRGEHGVTLVRSQVASETEFPFRAEFWQDAFTDRVQLALHYRRSDFPAEQIGRIAGYYARALEELVRDPEARHRAAVLLGDDELRQLTTEFTGPRRELPAGTALDLFDAQVRARPDAVAVRHGGSQLGYRELDALSARLAAQLRAAGVRNGDVVAVPMDRGTDWAVAVLAVLRSGGVYLPQDPADPVARLAAMVRRAGCRHVLTGSRHQQALGKGLAAELTPDAGGAPGAAGTAEATGTVELPAVLAYEELLDAPAPAHTPAVSPAPADPAYLIFTSGSTGEPKGALVHHLGLLNHLLAKTGELAMTERDRVAQTATQCFDISLWQLLSAWLTGGRTVIFDSGLVTDLPRFARTLEDERISVLEVVPSFLDALMSELDARPRPLEKLRWNLVTGEAFPPALSHRWFARYGVPLVNAYGPTETSDDITHQVVTAPVTGDRVPVGRAIANTGVHVTGPGDRLVPVGTYGEILVTGTAVGLGYLNDPDRTAAAFRPNTLDTTSERLYRTGDIGRWLPGGILDCAGRVDHQTKIRGFRIELSEVEGALARLPGVDHAVALVRREHGRELLVAHYTGDAEPDRTAFREALAPTLPAYMLPDAVDRADAFPVTRNGKVDRRALAARPLTTTAGPAPEPAADTAESALVDAFADVLGLPAETIGATGDFFGLGGHSLAAMRLAARLPGPLTLRDILESPTPRALAARIAGGGAGRAEAAEGADGTLTDLTAAAGLSPGPGAVTVVCVPFAGGGAVSYLAFAKALHRAGLPARVLGVEPGGAGGGELAAAIAARSGGAPLVLLGHSAGAVRALSAALALRGTGSEPAHVFAVAALPQPDGAAAPDPDEPLRLTDGEVTHWLAAHTGLDIGELAEGERRRVIDGFRADASVAARSWRDLSARGDARLDCPLTVLLAADDPLTRDHAERVHGWARFTRSLAVEFCGEGGHHLNATQPRFLAEQIRKAVGR
ncbi:amino acid adenylation domain-containing protein [Streptomyces sp. NPDC059398]|uniref:amino acid adenylation domain-containing protein n=1 Tax=Streptomyces sp. NPDC059398 TaxID=3346820 RepID=UPI0036A8B477